MDNKVCTLLFLRRDDEILLAMKKRGFGAGHWNGVGGKIDPGETVEQALVRETQEEIGVTPTNWQKIAEHDFYMDTDTNEPWHMYVHAYIADTWKNDPAESEEMAPKWFKISDIPFNNMWQDDPFWLPQALAGKKVFGTYTYGSDNNMLTHDVKVVENLPGSIPDKL
ncbi:MAG: 8-oxo-dGTP diphosphatase [Candidatus Saccharibacteria bacterium]|nr:8-oxo-dGTP diphosphatase [Candidatus Saccharibacteria bacterium]